MKTPIVMLLLRFFGRLRFPTLAAIAAILFIADIIVPDFIPFADELLLGLVTLIFAAIRKPKDEIAAGSAPEKDPRVIEHERRP